MAVSLRKSGRSPGGFWSSPVRFSTTFAICVLGALALLIDFPHCAASESDQFGIIINHRHEIQFSHWGQQTIARSFRYFSRGRGKLLADRVRFSAGGQPLPSPHPATAWEQGLFVLMLAAGAELRPADAALLDHYRPVLAAYWRVAHRIGGYNADPGPVPLNRYYDDNEWLTWGFLRAYRATHTANYLKSAETDFRFVLSGRSNQLGGGIFWHEQDRNYKNTCANAPAIIDAIQLYRITHHRRYFRTAESLYRWVNSHLQSRRTHLFYDGERLNHTINKTEWSYNSGAMVIANCLLYQVTQHRMYLHRAKLIAGAAEKKWIDPATGGVRDGGPFAWVLIDAFLHLYRTGGDKSWLRTAVRAMLYVRHHCTDTHGLYGRFWSRPVHPGKPRNILDQAAAGGAFFEVARTIQLVLRRHS